MTSTNEPTAHESQGIGSDWSPEKIARACVAIHVLANNDPENWKTKEEIHRGLAEFRQQKSEQRK